MQKMVPLPIWNFNCNTVSLTLVKAAMTLVKRCKISPKVEGDLDYTLSIDINKREWFDVPSAIDFWVSTLKP